MSTTLTAVPLGKLERVRVRDAWPDEARNFTPWLASTGLSELSEELGMDLRLLKCEFAVGRYSLDILATTALSEEDGTSAATDLVVIENQFGSTDHDHLGKLVTYASGVGEEGQGARTVIWISEDFREEHQQALKWLNEVTQRGVRFYGVQLELYRIGGSLAAPSFNVLVRPNEITRAREQAAQTKETERDLFYVEYWTAFKEYCANHNSLFRLQSPRPNFYVFASLGRAGVHISFLAARRDKWIGCELYINDADPAATYSALEKDRASIDSELPGLDWQKKPGVKATKIHLRKNVAPGDRTLWPEQHDWLFRQGNSLYEVFAPRLRNLQ